MFLYHGTTSLGIVYERPWRIYQGHRVTFVKFIFGRYLKKRVRNLNENWWYYVPLYALA